MKSTAVFFSFPNNPSRVFYSGQVLSGLVVLKLSKPKTVRGVYVKIIGRAYCRWRTGAGHHSKLHVGDEFYLNEKTFFVGDDSGGDVLLEPKQYNFNFSCMLPEALPTSVEGHTGHIRYNVAVHIEQQSLWSEHQQFNEYFTYPLVIEERTNFLACCSLLRCKSGELVINGCVPVRGYVPGQTIDLLLQINNSSDQSIRNFFIQIIKYIQFHTRAHSSTTKIEKIVIKKASCNGCSKNESKVYRIALAIPSVPPTDESTSNIVKVSYRLQIRGAAGLCHEDPVLSFPIKIGTYPILFGSIASAPIIDGASAQPTPFIRENVGSPSDPIQDPECIDPPTYEEAISNFMGDDIDGAFRPSYPVFRRTPSYNVPSTS